MYQKIAYDVEGSTAFVTLDRPERDGPFGDYSQGSAADKPNPRNVVYAGSLRGQAPAAG
ncbi:MAG: hypothetical protein JO118_12350 [Acetobacteraceae bacterium]|nr:hypothetical protein [Acetobacteraceae bacterium]